LPHDERPDGLLLPECALLGRGKYAAGWGRFCLGVHIGEEVGMEPERFMELVREAWDGLSREKEKRWEYVMGQVGGHAYSHETMVYVV
jgi:hypothetical protein